MYIINYIQKHEKPTLIKVPSTIYSSIFLFFEGSIFLGDIFEYTFDRIHVSAESFNRQITILFSNSQDPSIVHSKDATLSQDVKTIKINANGFKAYNGGAQT